MDDPQLKLMAVLAHPDDESLGLGGVLAKCAADGVETYLVTATRGERGRYFTNENRPSDAEVGRVRERELRAAADVLGVHEVVLLDYLDAELDRARPVEVIGRIVEHLRRVRPHFVISFDPFGAYGHPDHIAISQFATAAVAAAADATFGGDAGPAHAVSKLYYFVNDEGRWAAYQAAFKKLVSRVDGVERLATPWPDWSITTVVDTRAQADQVWRAVQCHESQMAVYRTLADLTGEQHEALWGTHTLYRAMSRVNGGREKERDVFDGLR